MLAIKNFPTLINEFFNDEWFDNFFNLPLIKNNTPTVNIIEEKDKYKIELFAPGLDKDDFKIDLNDNILTLSCEKKIENEEKDVKYLHREFKYSKFKRSFSLPDNVDINEIVAKYKNGILIVNIPKKTEEIKKNTRIIKIE